MEVNLPNLLKFEKWDQRCLRIFASKLQNKRTLTIIIPSINNKHYEVIPCDLLEFHKVVVIESCYNNSIIKNNAIMYIIPDCDVKNRGSKEVMELVGTLTHKIPVSKSS